MKLDKRDLLRVQHIREAIVLILQFTHNIDEEDFRKNELIQSAVIRQFEVIGEAASRVSQNMQDSYAEVEWRIIKDFRNLLIHEYFRIDASEVWYSVKFDIPVLKEQIEHILSLLE